MVKHADLLVPAYRTTAGVLRFLGKVRLAPKLKSRERGATAFSNVRAQFIARNSAAEDLDHVSQARDASTLRLREARWLTSVRDGPMGRI